LVAVLPANAERTKSLSGREKPAAGISGFAAATSSSPDALKTSTTPSLYSRCLRSTNSSSASRRPSRSRRRAAISSAMRLA
jgi:hypothetical protein